MIPSHTGDRPLEDFFTVFTSYVFLSLFKLDLSLNYLIPLTSDLSFRQKLNYILSSMMETLVSEMSGYTRRFTHNIFTQKILSTEKMKVSDLWNDRNFGCNFFLKWLKRERCHEKEFM